LPTPPGGFGWRYFPWQKPSRALCRTGPLFVFAERSVSSRFARDLQMAYWADIELIKAFDKQGFEEGTVKISRSVLIK
jgi:hypothetical protein